MIFVTVGSQKFQFDRLLKALDGFVFAGSIQDEIFAQTGYSTYEPKHYSHRRFLDRDQFGQEMAMCDTVITHGGTGAIIGAVKLGKKVLAVPRLVEHGEHVDNHQIEIVRQFAQMGLIESCLEMDRLAVAYGKLRETSYRAYQSNSANFMSDLSDYIDSVGRKRCAR